MTTMSRAIVRARPALLAAVLLLATATLAADPAEGTARDVLIRAATAKLGTDAVVEIVPGRDHGTIIDRALIERMDREMNAAVASATAAAPAPER